jgi:hypothetical protein
MEYQITRVSTDVPDGYHLAIDYTALQGDGYHPALMKSKFSHDPGAAFYHALLDLKSYLLEFVDAVAVPERPDAGDYAAIQVLHPREWERFSISGYQIKSEKEGGRSLILFGSMYTRRGNIDITTSPVRLLTRNEVDDFLKNPEDEESNPRPWGYVPGLLDVLAELETVVCDYINQGLDHPSDQLDIKFGKEHLEEIEREFSNAGKAAKVISAVTEPKKRGKKDPLPDSTAAEKGYPTAKAVDFNEEP